MWSHSPADKTMTTCSCTRIVMYCAWSLVPGLSSVHKARNDLRSSKVIMHNNSSCTLNLGTRLLCMYNVHIYVYTLLRTVYTCSTTYSGNVCEGTDPEISDWPVHVSRLLLLQELHNIKYMCIHIVHVHLQSYNAQ